MQRKKNNRVVTELNVARPRGSLSVCLRGHPFLIEASLPMYVRPPLVHPIFTYFSLSHEPFKFPYIYIYTRKKSLKNHLRSDSPNTQVFTTFTSYHILTPHSSNVIRLNLLGVLPNFVEPLHLAYHGLTPKYQTMTLRKYSVVF